MLQNFTISGLTIPIDQQVGLTTLDGFGNPFSKTSEHEYSNATGGLFMQQFYATRKITLGGWLKGTNAATFASVRRSLASAFAFDNAVKTFTLTTDDNLNLTATGIVKSDFALKYQVGNVFFANWQVDLDLNDPLFYSQTVYSANCGVTGVTGGFAIPFAIPFAITGTLTNTISATNSGNVKVFPSRIVLNGAGSNFTITNTTTGESLSLNYTLLTTDYVVFNFATKTALLNNTTNLYGYITGTWFKLSAGGNILGLSVGSGNDSNTQLSISYSDGYLAI